MSTAISRRLVLAMESIDFQRDERFIQKGTALIQAILDYSEAHPSQGVGKLPEVGKLEDLIFDRFKIKTNLKTSGHLAAIMPLYANESHVLLHEYFRGGMRIADQQKFLKENEGKVGAVDYKTATVSGFYSEYEHSLYLNFKQLVREFKLSALQILAVIAHEIGHAWEACAMTANVQTGNQVLRDIAEELNKAPKARNKAVLLQRLRKLNPEAKESFAEKLADGEGVVVSPASLQFMIGAIYSQMDNAKYDNTSFEALADNFAARLGLGGPLSEALGAIEKVYPEDALRQMGQLAIAFHAVVVFICALGLLLLGAVGVALIFFLLGTLLAYLLVLVSGEDGKAYVYDDLKIRYTRIRSQLVEQIKKRAFDAEDAQKLVNQIEDLDAVIKVTPQYRSWLDSFLNTVNPKDRKADQSIKRQQLLEQLASNDLFLQSLKLHLLA